MKTNFKKGDKVKVLDEDCQYRNYQSMFSSIGGFEINNDFNIHNPKNGDIGIVFITRHHPLSRIMIAAVDIIGKGRVLIGCEGLELIKTNKKVVIKQSTKKKVAKKVDKPSEVEFTKRELKIVKLAVEYAVGYMNGKHNTRTSKKERAEIVSSLKRIVKER